MNSERGVQDQLKREARAKPGQPIVSGKAPDEPGLYEVLTTLTVEEDADDGGGGSAGWRYTLANLPGGPVKSDAVRGKTFSDPSWMNDANKDYEYCTFTKEAFHSDQIGKNVRLINCTYRYLVPVDPGGDGGSAYGMYINMGKKGELRHGFVIFGGEVIGLRATEFGEFKAIDVTIIGLDLSKSPGIVRGVRVRHGAYALIAGCKGLKRVTLRGHHHACVDCPGTQVDFLAGDLPGKFDDWWPLKKQGKGSYQRAEFCYAQGVGGVGVGEKMQPTTPKKVFRCMVGLGQKHRLLEQEGFTERNIGSFKELCAL